MQQPDARARQGWMSCLALAPDEALAEAFAAFGPEPGHRWLRPPETGTAMVRGRAGATGAAFNLGEVTLTRCTLRLDDGRVGHAMVQGRDADKARRAALGDALMQGPEAEAFRQAVLDPLGKAAAERAGATAARAAATKVDFFTMVRGED